MLNEFSIVVDDKNNENAIRIKEHLLYNYKITLDIITCRVLTGIIMWAVTLALFAVALFTIKFFVKRKNKA